jgi:MoxR-like ATPase
MVTSINRSQLEYTGNVRSKPGERFKNRFTYPYIPTEALKNAVNLAIYLNRPLLLKGEPGSGKTQLAIAVAYELDLEFETWYIKSTSRAKDGLYIYDTVGRLRDAQLAASGHLTSEEKRRFDDPASYIRWGPLGRAFRNEKRTVVLIDEIDKADIDFPNDLLLELDEQIIKVDEVQVHGKEMEIQANCSPIVIITSNEEKDLPAAFLRRCLFHYIPFPSYERIVQIVKERFPDLALALADTAGSRFLALREMMKNEIGLVNKNVSTSELLDWIFALQQHPLEQALSHLEEQKLPHLEVLLKSWDAHATYLRVNPPAKAVPRK